MIEKPCFSALRSSTPSLPLSRPFAKSLKRYRPRTKERVAPNVAPTILQAVPRNFPKMNAPAALKGVAGKARTPRAYRRTNRADPNGPASRTSRSILPTSSFLPSVVRNRFPSGVRKRRYAAVPAKARKTTSLMIFVLFPFKTPPSGKLYYIAPPLREGRARACCRSRRPGRILIMVMNMPTFLADLVARLFTWNRTVLSFWARRARVVMSGERRDDHRPGGRGDLRRRVRRLPARARGVSAATGENSRRRNLSH